MSRLRAIGDRVGGPAAVSWATFWSSLAFNIYVAYWGSFTPTAGWVDRIIAVVASQATLWAFLLLCRRTVLSSVDTRPRPLVTVACFMVGGIIRALTVGLLYATVLDVAPFDLGPRIAAGAIFGIIAFAPAALIAGTVRDYRHTRGELLATRAQLSASAAALVEQVQASDNQATERIRGSILTALSEVEADKDAAALDRLASDVVRPLSHELAQEVPAWEPAEAPRERVRVAAVLDRALSGAPLMPITTTVIVFVIALVPLTLNATGPVTIAFFGGGFVVCLLALLVVNRVLPALLRGRPWWLRLATVVALLSAVGLALGFAAQALLGRGRLLLPFLEAIWLLVLAVGLTVALAKAAIDELEVSLADLRASDEQLAWQVARLRMIRWWQRQRLARALHGPVQGAITAAAARLRDGADSDADVMASLRHALHKALTLDHQPKPFAEGVDLVRANWEGLCEVTLVNLCDDIDRLDCDDAACEIAIDIVTEAVSNAVRHGKAQHVTVEASCESDRIRLRVIDDGGATEQSRPGLGTRLLDDCALDWSRESLPGSFRLEATLPLGDAA
jgi:signal transduction histidine kinase